MRSFWSLVLMILALDVCVWAQQPPPSGSTSPGAVRADSNRFDRLASIEMALPPSGAEPRHPLLDPKKGIYRRPTKKETEILAVAEPLIERFAAFLKQDNTGIVKLNADPSCVSTSDIVVASEKCVPYAIPGAGTAFSFRTESYRMPRLADVMLSGNIFKTGGVFQQVVMVELGDVPIDEVGLGTKGMKFLIDIKPVSESNEFLTYDKEVQKGIEHDGFTYRRGYPWKVNSTYALRSIAYRGKYMRSIDGVSYDELDFDKRRDIIAAFRVVDQDQSGNLTIVWKRLRDSEAPKLEISK